MAKPERLGHESEVRTHKVVPASERCAPLTDNQRWKLAREMLEEFGSRPGSKRWSEDRKENINHGLSVVRARAYRYGWFVARRLSKCIDKRRVRLVLREVRSGVGRLGTDLRIYFERGYAYGVVGSKKKGRKA